MKRFVLPFAGAMLWCASSTLHAQTLVESPHDLVKDTVYNELQERHIPSLWQYRVDKTVAGQALVEQQVETVSGLVNRVLSRGGKPLDPTAQKKESERLHNLLHNAGEQARMKQEYEAEEQRVQRLIATMPDAFICTYDGMTGDNIRLTFRPNPAYNPPTYEARVFHALAGELWIQARQKRLVKIDGHIESQIEFGYGLLGRIEKGGTFQIGREQVAANRWKTSVLDVHLSGRIVFFKTISKDQNETRSNFEPVATTFSVEDAVALLDRKTSP